MLRKHFIGFIALFVLIGIIAADEAKGKFKKWGGEKKAKTLVLTVGEKDVEFIYKGKDVKVFKGADEVKKKEAKKAIEDIKADDEITVIYDKDGDKSVVKELKLK